MTPPAGVLIAILLLLGSGLALGAGFRMGQWALALYTAGWIVIVVVAAWLARRVT